MIITLSTILGNSKFGNLANEIPNCINDLVILISCAGLNGSRDDEDCFGAVLNLLRRLTNCHHF